MSSAGHCFVCNLRMKKNISHRMYKVFYLKDYLNRVSRPLSLTMTIFDDRFYQVYNPELLLSDECITYSVNIISIYCVWKVLPEKTIRV